MPTGTGHGQGLAPSPSLDCANYLPHEAKKKTHSGHDVLVSAAGGQVGDRAQPGQGDAAGQAQQDAEAIRPAARTADSDASS